MPYDIKTTSNSTITIDNAKIASTLLDLLFNLSGKFSSPLLTIYKKNIKNMPNAIAK